MSLEVRVEMADPDKLQYIDLADFTQGISTEYHSLVADQPTPDGFARSDNTYGCYGLVNGGLAPLPRAIAAQAAHFDNAFLDDGFSWPEGDPHHNRIAILDARIQSPVRYSPVLSESNGGRTNPPVNAFLVRQWWMVDDDGPETRWRWTNRAIYQHGVGEIPGFDLQQVSAREGATLAEAEFNPHPSRWAFGWGSMAETRSALTDTIFYTGVPVLLASMGGIVRMDVSFEDGFAGYDHAGIWCTPSVAQTVSPQRPVGVVSSIAQLPQLWGTNFAGMIFGHQGRLCAITREPANYLLRSTMTTWGPYGLMGAEDMLLYWPVNNVFTSGGEAIATPLVSPPLFQQDDFTKWDTTEGIGTFSPDEEHPTGFGAYHSIDANNLLLVKHVGGAVMITGDIDRPTVTKLPGVPSTGGWTTRGANTDKGFVYGTSSGVWAFAGGAEAVNLAPHLHPMFWLPEDPTVQSTDPLTPVRQPGQLVGSFAYRWPYLYAPNNWMMDLRTGGWWRYWPTPAQDPQTGVVFAFNETDSNGDLWAFPASHRDGSNPDAPDPDGDAPELNEYLLYRQFALNTPTNYFTWQSQPLTRTRNRFLQFASVTLVASGVGRVTVELFGLDGETDTIDFDVVDNRVALIVEATNLVTTDMQVRITSKAGDDDDAAPTVHRLSLGYREAQGIPGAR